MRLALLPIFCLLISCSNDAGLLAGKPPEVPNTHKTTGKVYNPRVDVLFVIDNSGSMDSHQRQLQQNIDLFVNEIFKYKTLDFHIGVTTTTMDSWGSGPGSKGQLYGNPKYIEKNTPNGVTSLKNNLLVGTNGSGYEMSFDPIELALTPPNSTGFNAGFYRSDAHIAIVFITDAEDQSTAHTPKSIYDFLVNLKKGDTTKVLTYGVIIPTNDPTNCYRDETGVEPTRIEELFKLSNGKYYGLCDPNYGQKLAEMGQDIAMKVGKYYYLDRIPDINTIRVTFGSQAIDPHPITGWSYDPSLNAVVLGEQIIWSTQPVGVTLEVTYEPIKGN